MTKPDADNTAEALVDAAGITASKSPEPPVHPAAPPTPTNAKTDTIHVSPAILDAARKDSEVLRRDLRKSLGGLTQAEAEERARTTGPNEVAQERKQGWPVRLLKIIRNPLVILLTTLSAISFATGDARAGSVMAIMVALSVGLRFWQEARPISAFSAKGYEKRTSPVPAPLPIKDHQQLVYIWGATGTRLSPSAPFSALRWDGGPLLPPKTLSSASEFSGSISPGGG